MRRWLADGFYEHGRDFFVLGVFTMFVGALHMLFAHGDLGAFAVKAGAIECMVVFAWGWVVRQIGDGRTEEERPRSRIWISRDRTRRAVRENFPDDADEILRDINL